MAASLTLQTAAWDKFHQFTRECWANILSSRIGKAAIRRWTCRLPVPNHWFASTDRTALSASDVRR